LPLFAKEGILKRDIYLPLWKRGIKGDLILFSSASDDKRKKEGVKCSKKS
jgi:hypothetical protein